MPYPYTRTNTVMSKRSLLTKSTTKTGKGSLTDGATNSLISSRESSKNTDYYHSHSKFMTDSVKFPPIKPGYGKIGIHNKNIKDSNDLDSNNNHNNSHNIQSKLT